MSDPYTEAIDHALEELDAADDLEAGLAGLGRVHAEQALTRIAIRIGTALVYATLAVAEAIAAASEDTLGELVDERVDRALDETLEIAAELVVDADTVEIPAPAPAS